MWRPICCIVPPMKRIDSDRFYADLTPFTDFASVADLDGYAPAPDDWVVLAGDIVGSGRAISQGRYKAVNMLGAAVITAVLNACRGADLPFVFGGDGGAVAVPGRLAEDGARALRRLQRHAERVFGLSLRAVAVPVRRLREEGYDVLVGRLMLNESNHLAMFAGGGLARVDEIMKRASDDPDALSPLPEEEAPDLEGLSCRWAPLAASRGRMIALMVRPLDPDPAAAYARILRRLTEILGGLAEHAPATEATMRFPWAPRGLVFEAKAAGAGLRMLRALAWSTVTFLIQKWCHWRGVEIGGYHGRRYLEELRAQTDFRKFDDCLRIVLDCAPTEVEQIRRWLDENHAAGRLVHGLHEDREAIMTCLVFSLERSEHLHFIDAAGGGFARAAEDYKRRESRISQGLGEPS